MKVSLEFGQAAKKEGDGPFEFSWKLHERQSSTKRPRLRLLSTPTNSSLTADKPTTTEVSRRGKPSLRVISNTEHDLVRKFDCSNYNTCLGLAAALNWESFTCAQCNGNFNSQLFWRAHQLLKKDKLLAALCGLPSIAALTEFTSEMPVQYDGNEANTALPMALNFSKP